MSRSETTPLCLRELAYSLWVIEGTLVCELTPAVIRQVLCVQSLSRLQPSTWSCDIPIPAYTVVNEEQRFTWAQMEQCGRWYVSNNNVVYGATVVAVVHNLVLVPSPERMVLSVTRNDLRLQRLARRRTPQDGWGINDLFSRLVDRTLRHTRKPPVSPTIRSLATV